MKLFLTVIAESGLLGHNTRMQVTEQSGHISS